MSRLITDRDEFLLTLEARIVQLVERKKAGAIEREYAALELLMAVSIAYQGGLAAAEISSAYPVRHWREDQVLIPREWLQLVAESWTRYKESDGEVSLDQAFRLAGRSQGKSGSAKRNAVIDKEVRLSNAVVVILEEAEAAGAKISQEAAFTEVGAKENVGYETVRKAFQKHGKSTREKLKAARSQG